MKLPLTGKALLAIDYGDLRSAGYSASDLKSAGYSASALRSAWYSASDLRSAGYSASALISAGYSVSALIIAGYSVSDLKSVGYSASDLRSIEALEAEIPKLEKPYSRLWKEIQMKKRIHKQSDWGPEKPSDNICGTPMCTAGHLVNMAGEAGYKLKDATSWSIAASIIHYKAHPDIPPQNFNSIPQELALAYIEQMAKYEEENA